MDATNLPQYVDYESTFATWKDDLLSGKQPTFYKVGRGDFDKINIGPKRVVMIGAPPGIGKTALVMQWVFDALQFNPELKAIVANVEMSPDDLLNREFARFAGVPLDTVIKRKFDGIPVNERLATFPNVDGRLIFLQPPFTLDNVCAAAGETEAELIVLDYIQRIAPTVHYKSSDPRHQNNEAMAIVRRLANEFERAVIVVSSVGRGDKYKKLGLSSFKESGELEFGVDDAYILEAHESGELLNLKHVKARYGVRQDVALSFKHGRFSSVEWPTEAA